MEIIDSRDKLIRMVEQYKNLVFSICLKMTGDYFAAEDISQETFITAFSHIGDITPEAEKAWLARVATNKCIDWLKSAARRSIPVSDEEMPEIVENVNAPLNTYLGREVETTLLKACESLPPPYDETSRLYFANGLTAKEIALKTGTGLKTVQTRIARAREMLKQKIRKEDLLQ